VSNRLIIVIPAYNEAANIEALVGEWHPVVQRVDPTAKLVVVDDGSTDQTYQLLQQLTESGDFPRLTALTKANSGHGSTLLFAYRWALEQGADYIFQTDSDRQTLPEEFGDFWAGRDQVDATIGWRKQRQDGASRVAVTKVLKWSVAVVFRKIIPDANCPFRLVKSEALAMALRHIPDNYNLTNVLVSVRLVQMGKTVAYRPITFRPRQGGVNSINLPRITRIGLKAVRDFTRLRRPKGQSN